MILLLVVAGNHNVCARIVRPGTWFVVAMHSAAVNVMVVDVVVAALILLKIQEEEKKAYAHLYLRIPARRALGGQI
jgi:hypothetical protein